MHYIEVTHEYVDGDEDENTDVWWAVRPTPNQWRPRGGKAVTDGLLGKGPWQITPGNYTNIWDQNDIDGLRKLLDKIEEALKHEERKS